MATEQLTEWVIDHNFDRETCRHSMNGFDFHGQNASFDAMPYANFQGTQFLDLGLVNNPSIPFPESGPSAVLLFEPIDRIYLAAAGVSTTADAFTFVGSDDFNKWMYLTEAGFVAQPGGLPGLYYTGYWYSQFKDAPSTWPPFGTDRAPSCCGPRCTEMSLPRLPLCSTSPISCFPVPTSRKRRRSSTASPS